MILRIPSVLAACVFRIFPSGAKQGYIVCKRDDKDRRYVKYELTDASEHLCQEMEILWAELTAKVVEGIDESSLAVFNRVSEQISHNIDRLLEND